MTDRLEVVLCLVDEERVAAPTRHLEQIIEFQLHRQAPGSAGWVGGLAVVDGAVLPSLTLAASPLTAQPDAAPRGARGLLFKIDGRRFVVEVQRVTGLAEARVVGASLFRTWRAHCPPTWLLDAATEEKEVVPLVNVSALSESLAT